MQIGAYRSRSLAFSGYVYSEMKYVDTSKSVKPAVHGICICAV